MNSNQPFDVHGSPNQQPAPVTVTDVRYGQTTTMVDALGNPYQQPVPAQQYTPNQNFTVPAGTAEVAKQEAEPQPTMVDSIASDAKTDEAAAPILPPEGAPVLRPLHRLPFRERGKAMRLFGELRKIESPKEGEEPSFDQIADMYDGLGAIDDFLASVAENEDEYRAWVAGPGADESKFTQLWNAYSTQRQPGEASGSSS